MDPQAAENPIQYQPKKFEWAKVITAVVLSLLVIVVLFCLTMCAITLDSVFLSYTVELLKPATITVIGFYFWKSRGENLIKLKKIYGKDADSVIAAMTNQKEPSDSSTDFDNAFTF